MPGAAPLVGTAAGLAALAFVTLADPSPRLVWNGSASVVRGLYRIEPCPCGRGDLVVARLPEWANLVASQRGYLPPGAPVVKRIAGAFGDRICRVEERVFLNGEHVASAKTSDWRAEQMPFWQGCRSLARDEIFLLADHPASFDGRYIGATERAAIIGKAVPLWTFGERAQSASAVR